MLLFNMDDSIKCRKCAVKNCPTSRSDNPAGKRFFRFPPPDDPQRVLHWKVATSNPKIMEMDPSRLNLSYRVCSDHFEDRFMTGHHLNKTATPTLNLFLKPPSNDVETQTDERMFDKKDARTKDEEQTKNEKQMAHAQVQTTQDLSAHSPRKTKLRNLVKDKTKVIRKLFNENTKLKNSLELSSCSHIETMDKGEMMYSGDAEEIIIIGCDPTESE